MKFKTTKRDVMNGFARVISVGYCDMQDLLRYKNPVAYTCGVYGWNADIYDMGAGTAIVTGYRPFGNVKMDYSIVREYEKTAGDIPYSDDMREEKTNYLLKEALNKILGRG